MKVVDWVVGGPVALPFPLMAITIFPLFRQTLPTISYFIMIVPIGRPILPLSPF